MPEALQVDGSVIDRLTKHTSNARDRVQYEYGSDMNSPHIAIGYTPQSLMPAMERKRSMIVILREGSEMAFSPTISGLIAHSEGDYLTKAALNGSQDLAKGNLLVSNYNYQNTVPTEAPNVQKGGMVDRFRSKVGLG